MRFKPTELATVIVAAIAFLGAVASAFYTYTARNRELDIELVKIGIGILRADPKETQTSGAREWAIDVIETHSRRKFSDVAKSELLQNKLGYEYSGGYGFSPDHAYTYEAVRPPRPSQTQDPPKP
jgi:hypothetical protein